MGYSPALERIQRVNVTGERAAHTLRFLSGEPSIALHILKGVHRQTLRFYRQTGIQVNSAPFKEAGSRIGNWGTRKDALQRQARLMALF